MVAFKKLRCLVKDVGDKILRDDQQYFRVYRPIYLIGNLLFGNGLRRGSKTQFQAVRSGFYRAIDPDGTDIAFCERTRFRRYHYPEGVKWRIHQDIGSKYQNENIKVQKGDIVIDVGANIGEFSIGVARQASQVFSIDPDPSVYECLKYNTDNIGNVSVHQLALSDGEGEVDFYLSSKDADSSLFKPENFSEVIKVHSCKLDTFVEDVGLERVDFLKIEAEGWEPEILAGAEKTLAITRDVAVDAGPERGGESTVDDVVAVLSSAKFDVFVSRNVVFGSRPSRIGVSQ